MSIPTAEEFLKINKKQNKEQNFYFGVVTEINNNKAKIIFDGEDNASNKFYPCLFSYGPKIGDDVLLVKVAASYVVLGKIER